MEVPHNLKKMPGNVMPIANTDNCIKDLTILSKLELLDLKHREMRLLSNERQLNKLPDKGARIKQMYDRILAEEARRACLEDATLMFSNLNIADRGSAQLTAMEWKNGKVDEEACNRAQNDNSKDSDDEYDVNFLKIIAQRTKNEQERKINVEAELVALDLDSVKPKLEKVLSTAHKLQPDVDAHSHYFIKKTEQLSKPTKKEKFKPFKTTIHNTHDPAKEMSRKIKNYWENTAATPPLIQHSGTQMVSLTDSIKIQNEYILKMKKLQDQQAMERLEIRNSRLAEREKLKEPTEKEIKSKQLFSKYRDIEGHLKEEEKDTDDDLTEEDKFNIINYTFSE